MYLKKAESRKELTMDQRYESSREYSLMDILKYNLRKWWLAAILAAIFAVIVGGYKAKTLMPYIDAEVYEDRMQVQASIFVSDFNTGSSVERANNIMKIAKSSSVYEEFCKVTGIDLTKQAFTDMFECEQTEASDIVTLYVVYPRTSWDYTVDDEDQAFAFMNGLLEALDTVTKKEIGTQCFTVFDAPESQRNVEKIASYTISKSEYRQAVLKAVTAGILLGILLEVVCYTLWMMIYKKPKDADEVQTCLETPVVEVINKKNDGEESYKKVALFLDRLKEDKNSGVKETGSRRINILPVGRVADETALRVAMAYANEKKKTLLIDLNAADSEEASLSAYVMGTSTELKLQQMNEYLDTVKRNKKQENGFDLVGNEKFKELLDRFSKQYDYILINGRDAASMSEGYEAAVLCDSNLVICGRRNAKTEALYTVKNTAEVNHIHLDGVVVYDL